MRTLLSCILFLSATSFSAEDPAVLQSSVATPWTVKATDHFILSNASEDASNKSLPAYKLFMNEATVRAEYGSYNGKIQFSNRFTPDGDQGKNAAFRLEKKQIAYEGEKVEVKLGDSYQELGKGIALSLYHDASFGIDHTLEGASFAYRGDLFSAGTFGGRLNTLRLPVAINRTVDPLLGKDVWLAGLFGKGKYSKEGTVGLHSVVTFDQNYENGRMTKRYATLGASLQQENILDGVDAYFESNYMNTETLDPVRKTLAGGYASYAALTWSSLPWKVKAEGKDYRSFEYEWQRPPTLEEDVIRENNFKDVSAVRLGVERRLFAQGTANVYGTYLYGYDREWNAPLNHPIVGTKFPLSSRMEMELKGGYRWLSGKQNLVHTGTKAKLRTWKAQALEAEYRLQFWKYGLDSEKSTREDRHLVSLGYIFNEAISAQVGYEYKPTNDSETGKNFYNVGGVYRTGHFATRAFLGQTSGGVQCAGGICRRIDPYTGAYLETTVSF